MTDGVVLTVVLNMAKIDVMLQHELANRLTNRLVYDVEIILNGERPILE
ncbi:hypothetical protein AB0K48_24210 [Nonomuraea sp. NPDC055795]